MNTLLNDEDEKGWTPIHYAVDSFNESFFDFVLNHFEVSLSNHPSAIDRDANKAITPIHLSLPLSFSMFQKYFLEAKSRGEISNDFIRKLEKYAKYLYAKHFDDSITSLSLINDQFGIICYPPKEEMNFKCCKQLPELVSIVSNQFHLYVRSNFVQLSNHSLRCEWYYLYHIPTKSFWNIDQLSNLPPFYNEDSSINFDHSFHSFAIIQKSRELKCTYVSITENGIVIGTKISVNQSPFINNNDGFDLHSMIENVQPCYYFSIIPRSANHPNDFLIVHTSTNRILSRVVDHTIVGLLFDPINVIDECYFQFYQSPICQSLNYLSSCK